MQISSKTKTWVAFSVLILINIVLMYINNDLKSKVQKFDSYNQQLRYQIYSDSAKINLLVKSQKIINQRFSNLEITNKFGEIFLISDLIESPTLIVRFRNGNCGSCVKEIIDKIENNNYSKVLFITDNDSFDSLYLITKTHSIIYDIFITSKSPESIY